MTTDEALGKDVKEHVESTVNRSVIISNQSVVTLLGGRSIAIIIFLLGRCYRRLLRSSARGHVGNTGGGGGEGAGGNRSFLPREIESNFAIKYPLK